MITGLSPNALYTDSVPCHDFRDPSTWQSKPAEGWSTGVGTVSGITLMSGDPVEVTATAHGMTTGMNCTFASVVGTTELNDNTYKVTVVDANTFTLDDTDSDNFTAYTSGGTIAWNDYDSSFTVYPTDGQAIVLSSVWLKMSQNAVMHSPLLIQYKAKTGTLIRQTTYNNLDDFLDRFTSYTLLEVARYTNNIEFYEYMFPQPLVLRTADTPAGYPMPYFHSITIKVQDDQPYYNDEGGSIEFCRVRYPDVQVHLDTEYTG